MNTITGILLFVTPLAVGYSIVMKRVLSFEDLPSAACADTADDQCPGLGVSNTQQRLKRSRKGGNRPTSQQLSAIDDTIDDVISQVCGSPVDSPVETNQLPVQFDIAEPCKTSIGDLLNLIKEQRSTIHSLECKVNDLVSQMQRVSDLLGLSTLPNIPPTKIRPNPAWDVCAALRRDGDGNGDGAVAVAVTETVAASNDETARSTADPIGMPTQNNGRKSMLDNKSLKDMVLNTIHRDALEREKRRKNVIVSGLDAMSEISDDAERVQELFRAEFDFEPDITFCKRLGQSFEGRTQPLLVALGSAEDSSWLIANASRLRQSRSTYVRERVFINAFLSRPEAHAAYEARCRRRAARAENSNGTPQSRVVVNSRRQWQPPYSNPVDQSSGTKRPSETLAARLHHTATTTANAVPRDNILDFPVLTRDVEPATATAVSAVVGPLSPRVADDSHYNASAGRQPQEKSAAATAYVAV